MARKNGAEKELRWREIVDRQAKSGLSIREFCAKAGVSQPSFYAWRKKFRERENERAQARKPRCSPDEPDNGDLFVPLQLVESSAALEVVHPTGYRVRVIGNVNPIALRHVIEVLDERGGR
jgi:transposase-like protein